MSDDLLYTQDKVSLYRLTVTDKENTWLSWIQNLIRLFSRTSSKIPTERTSIFFLNHNIESTCMVHKSCIFLLHYIFTFRNWSLRVSVLKWEKWEKKIKIILTSFNWDSPEKETAKTKALIVSQQMWHRKDPFLLKGHRCQA